MTTVSKEFYDKHLGHVAIEPLDTLLSIECADGNDLPYLGYVEIELEVSGLPVGSTQACLALVVPSSTYNSTVPLLIDTNLLSVFLGACKDEYGDKMLQSADLFTPWQLSFRCMLLRDRELTGETMCWGM